MRASRIAQRVASRFKVADLEESLPAGLKSLDNLVKRNQGLFKTPKQGAFLWRWAKGYDESIRRDMKMYSHGKFNPGVIDHWGAPFAKGENAFTALFVMRLKQGGHTDIKRIRFFGYAYVIDGAGVAATGKLSFKYEYDPSLEPGVQIWPDGVETTWVRQAEAPEVFSHAQSERERAQRVEQNREMIDRIKALPEYEIEDAKGHQILQSFVKQMEGGKKLSPAQLGILRKFLDNVSLGDVNEWVARRDALFADTEVKVVKPFLKGLQHGVQQLKQVDAHPSQLKEQKSMVEYFERLHDEMHEQWASFKRRPTKDLAIMSRLYEIARLLDEHARFPSTRTAGLFVILMSADQLAKKGQKAPSTALKNSWAIDKTKEWLEHMAPSRVEEIARDHAMAGVESLTKPDAFSAFRVAQRLLEAVIRKEKGKYCVRSPNNPDWNGGCYDQKGEAEKRLSEVEYFKRQARELRLTAGRATPAR